LLNAAGAARVEITELLLTAKGVRLERIVSHGQASPEGFWYDQTQAEWVMVLSGAARLTVEGDPDELPLGPGDAIFLPPHCRHRVTWTDPAQPTVWLALFVDAALEPTEASGT
jgi:cupin 2 domain-containing protein